jgi:hypothetical protein
MEECRRDDPTGAALERCMTASLHFDANRDRFRDLPVVSDFSKTYTGERSNDAIAAAFMAGELSSVTPSKLHPVVWSALFNVVAWSLDGSIESKAHVWTILHRLVVEPQSITRIFSQITEPTDAASINNGIQDLRGYCAQATGRRAATIIRCFLMVFIHDRTDLPEDCWSLIFDVLWSKVRIFHIKK